MKTIISVIGIAIIVSALITMSLASLDELFLFVTLPKWLVTLCLVAHIVVGGCLAIALSWIIGILWRAKNA